jgi:hypothetical protein
MSEGQFPARLEFNPRITAEEATSLSELFKVASADQNVNLGQVYPDDEPAGTDVSLMLISGAVEPEVPLPEKDWQQVIASTHRNGVLVGLAIGIKVFPDVAQLRGAVDQALDSIFDKEKNATAHGRHEIAETIVDLGMFGCTVVEGLDPVIEDATDLLCTSVPHQTYFKSGVGFGILVYQHAASLESAALAYGEDLGRMEAELLDFTVDDDFINGLLGGSQ